MEAGDFLNTIQSEPVGFDPVVDQLWPQENEKLLAGSEGVLGETGRWKGKTLGFSSTMASHFCLHSVVDVQIVSMTIFQYRIGQAVFDRQDLEDVGRVHPVFLSRDYAAFLGQAGSDPASA